MSRYTQKAFTLVEMAVVMVIIGILATISVISYNGVQERAIITQLQSDLHGAAAQLASDRTFGGGYPATVEAANGGAGLPKSKGTILQYTYSASKKSYCLTATSERKGVPSFMVTSGDTTPREGGCPGHSGGPSLNCPTGFIVVPGSLHYGTTDFCVMKYEAKNVAGVPTSQASGTPWVSISQTTALTVAQSACDDCQLITEAQWMTIATNVMSVDSNWSGGSVGSGFIYSGHNDNNPNSPLAASLNDENGYESTGNTTGSNQRRTLTLTNGEVIWDLAGNVYEWTQGRITEGQPGLVGESAFVWKDYSDGGLQWNSLPSTSRPTGTLYPISRGVGALYSNTGDTSLHAFARGGHYNNGLNAGVSSLIMQVVPSDATTTLGFRVTR